MLKDINHGARETHDRLGASARSIASPKRSTSYQALSLDVESIHATRRTASQAGRLVVVHRMQQVHHRHHRRTDFVANYNVGMIYNAIYDYHTAALYLRRARSMTAAPEHRADARRRESPLDPAGHQ